jgi:hypothetical protein
VSTATRAHAYIYTIKKTKKEKLGWTGNLSLDNEWVREKAVLVNSRLKFWPRHLV